MSNIRYSPVFVDSKDLISSVLNKSKQVSIRKYGSLFSNLCEVRDWNIEEGDDVGASNITLTLTYMQSVLTADSQFNLVTKTRKLKVLSVKNDNEWSYQMVDKIWDGEYPSTVAVDLVTGEVLLFNIGTNRIELVDFGVMEDTQFEAFILEVNDQEPYRIRLNPDAMFDYISGAEGYRHLKENVEIEFNCGIPVTVSPK